MQDILEKIALCVERGKADKDSPFPPDMKRQDGASEFTAYALEQKISAKDILDKALMPAMRRVGDKFAAGKAYIPDLLISAKAMNAAMLHLKPFFESGEVKHRGQVVLGTVTGDLHDIGKNIVKMVLKGEGWDVIDLGVDVSSEKFIEAIEKAPGCHVGLSALLTTTMVNMEGITSTIKAKYEDTKVFLGGAPLSQEFNDKIGADGYFPDPYGFARHLSELAG